MKYRVSMIELSSELSSELNGGFRFDRSSVSPTRYR
jgi:hypothetical protein